MAVRQNPVLLLRVEEKAEDVKIQPILLIRGSLVRADQQTALHLWIREQHDLEVTDIKLGAALAGWRY